MALEGLSQAQPALAPRLLPGWPRRPRARAREPRGARGPPARRRGQRLRERGQRRAGPLGRAPRGSRGRGQPGPRWSQPPRGAVKVPRERVRAGCGRSLGATRPSPRPDDLPPAPAPLSPRGGWEQGLGQDGPHGAAQRLAGPCLCWQQGGAQRGPSGLPVSRPAPPWAAKPGRTGCRGGAPTGPGQLPRRRQHHWRGHEAAGAGARCGREPTWGTGGVPQDKQGSACGQAGQMRRGQGRAGRRQQHHGAPRHPPPLPAASPPPRGAVTHSRDRATQRQAAATGPWAHPHAKINPNRHAKPEAANGLTCAN